MRRAFGYAVLAAALLAGGCVPYVLVAAGPPVYCYRTLADVDCYLEPVPTDTLVGVAAPLALVPAFYPGFY